jgi:transposase
MRKSKKTPEKITLSQEDASNLVDSISNSNLSEDVKSLVLSVINFNVWLQQQLALAKLSIKKLRKLFGFKNESRKSNNSSSGSDNNQSNKKSDDNTDTTPQDNNPKETPVAPQWNPDHNHGRYSADEYTGCPITHIQFLDPSLQNNFCPRCATDNIDANIIAAPPKILVFLKGQPILSGDRYYLARARCLTCQTYFTAPLPEELVNRPKYSPSCVTSLVIHHYYGGMPFKRIENLQKLQGVPFADATQYDYVNKLYTTSVAPVIEVLKQQAANGNSLFFDDTPGRILEQMGANKKTPQNKSGIHITALLSVYDNHRIYLFNTNRLTAGKEFSNLIENRSSESEFTTMTDASSSNFPDLNDDLMARWIITLCLCHGRRYFVDLLGEEDEDISLVLDIISRVYLNEKHCKENNLTDDERLLYHQTHSGPLMSALHDWLNNLMLYKKVEPNSPHGKAITYLLKRWYWLTQFLRIPGAALDNNISEIAIKVAIRYRKNSLFYKTFYGATIGDAMMSLLHTAAYANVNIFDYLNALQIYASEVQASPENWLPWNHQATIATLNDEVTAHLDTG